MPKRNEHHYKCPPTVTMQAYCVRCKAMVTIGAPDLVSWDTPSGRRYALQGNCPHDGQRCNKIISKARAIALHPELG